MKFNVNLKALYLNDGTIAVYKDGKRVAGAADFLERKNVKDRISLLNSGRNLDDIIEALHDILSNPRISFNNGTMKFEFKFVEPDGNYTLIFSSEVDGLINFDNDF